MCSWQHAANRQPCIWLRVYAVEVLLSIISSVEGCGGVLLCSPLSTWHLA